MLQIIHAILVLGQPMMPADALGCTKCDASRPVLIASSGGRRRGPGSDHGDDLHGDDPHDEQHDGDLPANGQHLPGNSEQDKYYKGGVHIPD
jgi:hypothetical protein